jgi:UDP-glucose 4-epimerase
MRIAITGGAGFIGSHLADRLLALGHDILVVDNFATGRRDNLTPHPRLRVEEGTIADQGLVDRLLAEFAPEQVVHAAASYRDPDDWAEDIRTNVLGTAHVVRAAARTGCRRLIYFQTALCYGLRPLEQPITLSHPVRPEGSSYALSKTAGEEYIALSGLDFVSFRLANAYGPRNLSGPLPTFFQRLTGGLPCFVMDTRRDFIYVADLVEVVLMALEGKGGKGYYHVATGSDYAIEELYRATLAALGMDPGQRVEVRPRREDDAFTILLDPSRTHADFGWRATTPLQAGVAAAVAWYREHGLARTYTHLKPPDGNR